MKYLIMIFFISLIYLTGCHKEPQPVTEAQKNEAVYQVTEHIWYISVVGEDFCTEYEYFLNNKLPEGYTIKQIIGDNSHMVGTYRGFFIILEKTLEIDKKNNK